MGAATAVFLSVLAICVTIVIVCMIAAMKDWTKK